MRITVLGKGGSGKTTLTAMLTCACSDLFSNILAIDADINDHFGEYIGFSETAPLLGTSFDVLIQRLYGHKKRLLPPIGTIPPTTQDKFINFTPDDWFLNTYALRDDKSLYYVNVGKYTNNDIGSSCFHGKLNSLEFVLHRLLDTPEDCVIVDPAAGTDVLATSLYTAMDVYFFAIEPTEKSIQVYKDYIKTLGKKIKSHPIVIKPIFNKVQNDKDLEFLRSHIPVPKEEEVIFNFDPVFRLIEQGQPELINQLVTKHHRQLAKMLDIAKKYPRDNQKYLRNLLTIFREESEMWANDHMNYDLSLLVDSCFKYPNYTT